MGQAVLSDPVTRYRVVGVPYMCFVCVCVFVCAGSPSERKGIGLIFPTLPTEIGDVCVLASTYIYPFFRVCMCL